MRCAAHTLGCKLNFAETSHLLRQLSERGHTIVNFDDEADLYIINTCTVTAIAEKKCRNAIRQASRRNPDAQVAVIGCFAQNAADAIAAIPGVTIILGNDRKHRLPELIDNTGDRRSLPDPATPDNQHPFPLAYSSGDRTRCFLKIQDGCDYFCTYCAIPFARGRSRSATVEQVLQTVREIETQGIREVVLTGVNTGTFGQHHGENLLQLLRRLDNETQIQRYRISSIEPNLITEEMVRFIAGSRAFLPHFHIPLQSGSDKVLQLMHRRYDTALYRDKVEYILSLMPDACIAADIIAGFNGEDESEFQHVCRYVDSLPLSYLHVFTYSDRPDTAALRMDGRIPVRMRRDHSLQLHRISNQKREAFYRSQTGTVRPVLWESTRHPDGTMQGWTDNYIRISRHYDDRLVGTVTDEHLDEGRIVYNFPTES
ncbi:MAG: MiaB-like tRNA modifying protein [bacterium P3]|nr:MAG: MiaB-like tRNA modifying protein [bacterium P3]KWW42008.1 MAG: MiaB-like tRNA modifying protein [bacterium F083]